MGQNRLNTFIAYDIILIPYHQSIYYEQISVQNKRKIIYVNFFYIITPRCARRNWR